MDFAQAATSWFDSVFGGDHHPRDAYGRRRQWTGEELRAIRAAKGVGKRHPDADRFAPHVDAWVRRCYQVNEMYLRYMIASVGRCRVAS